MKVAGYVRVSTKKQLKEGNHERQREQLQNWAERNDHQLEIFEDLAISGTSRNRESYEEMMDQIQKFDALVVKNLQRFGRDLLTMIKDIEQLGEKGVEFISLSENLDTTTAQGKLLFQVMGAFSEFYANKKREETLAMIERRREQGKTVGRKKKLPQEDRKELFRMWEEKELSYRSLAKLFEDRVSGDDKTLSASTVKRYIEEFNGGDE